jgi:hypothetical protein
MTGKSCYHFFRIGAYKMPLKGIATCFLVAACASIKGPSPMSEPMQIPFSYFEKTFMVLPVQVNGTAAQDFIFDTGIGVNLISKKLCDQVHCKIGGQHSGRRMSGQEVHIPMSSLEALSFGEYSAKKVPVGVFDLEAMMPGSKIGGFLSRGFFQNLPITVDYQKKLIMLESRSTLEKIRSVGVRVPICIDIQGPSVVIFMPLILPSGRKISVEVDTGSQALILKESFMKELKISSDSPDVQRKDGKDETGHSYSRFYTKFHGSISIPQSSSIKSDQPDAMFQKIIYEGLIGHYFLSQFLVTYDLENSEMIFRLPVD